MNTETQNLSEKQIQAIEQYQCSGCAVGCNISCYKKRTDNPDGIECAKHFAGTGVMSIGKIFLGMPKGFNRLGESEKTRICIYYTFSQYKGYDTWNIPVWKYLENGHTFVRGISPRVNRPFIHVFLEDCMEKINCTEITKELHDFMD